MAAVDRAAIRATRVVGGRTVQEIEKDYRIKGNTTFSKLFGSDPLDFWIGPFYVGFWGAVSAFGAALGAFFYIYGTIFLGPRSLAQNFLAGRLDPPPVEVGLGLQLPGQPGFLWQMTVLFTTICFFGWMMRQVDISMKLDMYFHVPISYFVVFSAWLTLQVIRPILMGSWHEGFTLGVLPHLDWVSNFGYRYVNFFYNPFHDLGITGLFASTLFLAMHGSAILSAGAKRDVHVDHLNAFWYDLLGYSIGEIGIHRLAFISAIFAIVMADLCIVTSGPLVQDWAGFWTFWNNLPWWSGF